MNGIITAKTTANLITQLEAARMLRGDITVRRLRSSEHAWGLDRARVNTGNRSILYRRDEVERIWKKRNFL